MGNRTSCEPSSLNFAAVNESQVCVVVGMVDYVLEEALEASDGIDLLSGI